MAEHQPSLGPTGQETVMLSAISGMSTRGRFLSADEDALVPCTDDEIRAQEAAVASSWRPIVANTPMVFGPAALKSPPPPLAHESSLVTTPFTPIQLARDQAPPAVLTDAIKSAASAAMRQLKDKGVHGLGKSMVVMSITPGLPAQDVPHSSSLAVVPLSQARPNAGAAVDPETAHPGAYHESSMVMHTATSWKSWQAAVASVAQRFSNITSSMRVFDWFHHKTKETGLLTPAGSSTTTVTSTVNLVSGTLDAGVLAMPLMMSYVGWLLGIVLVIGMAALGVFTTRLLVMVSIAEHSESYHMTILRTLGKPAMTLFMLLLICGTVGSLLAYLMLIGDFAEEAALHMTRVPISRPHAVVFFTIFFVLPLAMMRKLKSLWFTGFLTMAFLMFLSLALFARLVGWGVATSGVTTVSTTPFALFQALPLATYCLTSHASVLPVFHEMRHRSITAFTIVSAWTYFWVSLLVILIGLSGYLLFGSAQSGNVLQHFNFLNDELMAMVALCLLFTMVFAYPVMNFPLRISLHYLLWGETDATRAQHVLETAAPLVVVLCGALVVRDVGAVFAVIGAVQTTTVFFVFPCLMYLRSKHIHDRPKSMVAACIVIMCFGSCILVFGLLTALT